MTNVTGYMCTCGQFIAILLKYLLSKLNWELLYLKELHVVRDFFISSTVGECYSSLRFGKLLMEQNGRGKRLISTLS